MLDLVLELRKADEAADKEFQKYCHKIMQELHQIPEDQLTWNGPVHKKKVTVAPTPIDPTKRKKRRIKE